MSRIGKQPVTLEKGVKAAVAGRTIKVEGPKGKLEYAMPDGYQIDIKDSILTVKRPGDTQEDRSKHGLVRKLIANMATGVSKGFTRVLEINGVGYRAEVKGTNIRPEPLAVAE